MNGEYAFFRAFACLLLHDYSPGSPSFCQQGRSETCRTNHKLLVLAGQSLASRPASS